MFGGILTTTPILLERDYLEKKLRTEFRKVIETADADGNGKLNSQELKEMLRDMEYQDPLRMGTIISFVRPSWWEPRYAPSNNKITSYEKGGMTRINIPSRVAERYLQSHKRFHQRPRNTI